MAGALRPPRIGLFVIAFPRASETFIVTKVLKLVENGFDVQIFTLSPDADWESFEVLEGRDDVRERVCIAPPLSLSSSALTLGLRQITARALRHPGEFARLAAHTLEHRNEHRRWWAKSLYERAMFIGHQLDILHIEFDYQGLEIADLKDYFGCRLLLSARGTFQKSSTFRSGACEYLFRYADGYHVISRYLEDNIRRLGLPPDVPTWRIEPAIDLSLFTPPASRTRAPGRPLRIVSVGRLCWQKGYEFAIDAVARLRKLGVDFKYTIYGAGPYEQAVRFAIREYGLSDRVTIAGPQPREQIPRLLADADVMLHSAIEEGFCNAVVEAQAMCLPVVTSDAGGLPENVENGVTGFVAPRRDATALAEKLALLASSPELRARMGQAGRARALARFDLDRQAEAFVHLYRELLSLPRRAVVRSG